MKTVIGIDLGEENCRMAVFRDGKVEILITDTCGSRSTPMWIMFTKSEKLIGKAAKEVFCQGLYTTQTIFHVQKIIGRKYEDHMIQSNLLKFPFTVENVGGSPRIAIVYKNQLIRFTPEQLIAMILREMKRRAEHSLRENVTSAVISVPAHFEEPQIRAIKDAVKIAGLEVLSITPRPVAATIAYGLGQIPNDGERNVLVFNFGRTTFDVSILTVHECKRFKVKAIAGNTNLGGENINNCLVDYFLEIFKRKTGKDARSCEASMDQLHNVCEGAKLNLSNNIEARVDLYNFFSNYPLHEKISRCRLNSLCDVLFRQTIDLVERVLNDAKMNKGAIDHVIMVGGSSKIPQVQRLLHEFFDGKGVDISDESFVHGVSIHAAILGGNVMS